MKPRTKEENAAYQREYRRLQKLKRMQSRGLGVTPVEGVTETPQVDSRVDAVDVSTYADPPFPRPLTSAQRIAAGLAAPDDDCGACGHDRQMYHLGLEGRCTAAVGVKSRCGCPAFVDPAEPF